MASNVTLSEDVFGSFNGEDVKRFKWETTKGIQVSVITYGATITSIKVPDIYGVVKDITLGFDDMEGYRRGDNPYFGATVGRCANRIARATFRLGGTSYQLAQNVGQNHLHGGIVGFDKANWIPHVVGNKVTFSHLSPHLDEGYPGNLVTSVSYQLLNDGTLEVDFTANTDRPTVVNLTNHSYFNLAGHDGGAEELYEHLVSINADRITEVTDEAIPTGDLIPVGGTPFDLRVPVRLADRMGLIEPGYDHNFCISRGLQQKMTFVSRVVHPTSGRYLEVYSDQPGVQLYSSNFLPAPDKEALPGKSGVGYRRHGAFCLETQNFPDAVHHGTFPSPILAPGEPYVHRVKYLLGNMGERVPFVQSN